MNGIEQIPLPIYLSPVLHRQTLAGDPNPRISRLSETLTIDSSRRTSRHPHQILSPIILSDRTPDPSPRYAAQTLRRSVAEVRRANPPQIRRRRDSKCVRPSKHKKKKRRRNEPKVTSKIDHQKTNQKVENTQSPVCNESGNSFSCSPSRSSEMNGSAKDAFSVEFEFEDDDIDDDLDPAIKEELDRTCPRRQINGCSIEGGIVFRACSRRQINGCSIEGGNGSPFRRSFHC